MHDIVIIGGGPGGYVAAIRAAQRGANVALVEKDKLGGVCLHRGCVPSKTLLHAADLLLGVREAKRLGVEVAEPKVLFDKVMARKEKVVGRLHKGIQALLKARKVEVIAAEADLIGANRVKAGGREIEAKNIIIAVGSSPVVLPIPGADDACVITSDDALFLDAVPDSLAIIGGGAIGVEMACLFAAMGTKTTVLELEDRLVPLMDPGLSAGLEKMLKKQGVRVATSARVAAIEKGTVRYVHGEKAAQLPASKVLMAVGRRSNAHALSLDAVGIRHGKGVIETDDHMRTSVPNIYAIGDVNGKWMLAHVASKEGLVAVENIMGGDARISYAAVPQCVYTIPEELASVGLSEPQAKEQTAEAKVATFPLLANGKALATGRSSGFAKLITAPDGEILGAHLMGPHATDMIATMGVAMTAELTPTEIGEAIFPHPTVSEALQEAAHAIEGAPIHGM